MMEAEIRIMQLQTKEYQRMLTSTRSQEETKKDYSTESSEETWSSQHFDFGFLDSIVVRELSPVVLSHPGCGALIQ